MKTLLDIKNFLNQFSDEQLSKSPAYLQGEEETFKINGSDYEEDMYVSGDAEDGLLPESEARQCLFDGNFEEEFTKIYDKGIPFLFHDFS